MKCPPSILGAFAILCGAAVATDPSPSARDGLLLEYTFESDLTDSSGHERNSAAQGKPAIGYE